VPDAQPHGPTFDLVQRHLELKKKKNTILNLFIFCAKILGGVHNTSNCNLTIILKSGVHYAQKACPKCNDLFLDKGHIPKSSSFLSHGCIKYTRLALNIMTSFG